MLYIAHKVVLKSNITFLPVEFKLQISTIFLKWNYWKQQNCAKFERLCHAHFKSKLG